MTTDIFEVTVTTVTGNVRWITERNGEIALTNDINKAWQTSTFDIAHAVGTYAVNGKWTDLTSYSIQGSNV